MNLAWGGRDLVGGEAPGSFGYFKDMRFHKLFLANDSRAKDTVVSDPVVTLEIDLDVGTYTVGFNGKTYPDLPSRTRGRSIPSGSLPPDAARRFPQGSIDDVIVVGGRKPAVAKATGETDDPDFDLRRWKGTIGPRMQTSGELAGVDIKTFREQVA